MNFFAVNFCVQKYSWEIYVMLAGLYVYCHGSVPAIYLSNCVLKLAILQGFNGCNSLVVICTTQICLELSY